MQGVASERDRSCPPLDLSGLLPRTWTLPGMCGVRGQPQRQWGGVQEGWLERESSSLRRMRCLLRDGQNRYAKLKPGSRCLNCNLATELPVALRAWTNEHKGDDWLRWSSRRISPAGPLVSCPHISSAASDLPRMRTAVIIGAGHAGLTAALELLRRSDVRPIVLEATERIGGISCTIRHNGNRMDIGGHRFFSKADRVMEWWTELMPIASTEDGAGFHTIQYQNKERTIAAVGASADPDLVMLVRPRKSRIYFLRSFFDYPLALNGQTLRQLGPWRMIKIGAGYMWAKLFPRRDEKTLEDFLINRFGNELYLTFFKSYTEKVWGVPCDQISAEWGAQRIKGLSLRTAIAHFLKTTFSRKKSGDIAQKSTETSLIEKFLYPKYGPGQLWEYVADLVTRKGGEVRMGWRAGKLHVEGDRIVSVDAVDPQGVTHTIPADYVFSTMPVRDLIHSLDVDVPADIRSIGDGLIYRD